MYFTLKERPNETKVEVTNSFFFQIFYLQSHGWLIIYHLFMYGFVDDENEETLLM